MALNHPQPNFQAITTKFSDLGHELSLFRNIPAVFGGEQIIATLNRMEQKMDIFGERLNEVQQDIRQMNVRLTQVEDRLGALETRVGTLETRLGALETRVETGMADLNTRLGALETRVETGMADLNTSMANMQTRMDASDWNALARLQNSKAMAPGWPIQPIVTSSNEHIEDFPTTTTEISTLTTHRASQLLEQLGQPSQGNVDDKRRRLQFLCGITTKFV
ncbi:hypothetical protein F4859DRAFT_475476 [Xylaria cf. heliscus]|nr:hypothetical protein F4859DRAFT_475476 [Xylaria cf. heliscus]